MIVIWDGALWFWCVIKTIMTDWLSWSELSQWQESGWVYCSESASRYIQGPKISSRTVSAFDLEFTYTWTHGLHVLLTRAGQSLHSLSFEVEFHFYVHLSRSMPKVANLSSSLFKVFPSIKRMWAVIPLTLSCQVYQSCWCCSRALRATIRSMLNLAAKLAAGRTKFKWK